VSNAFPPNHPKSILYSVRTLYATDLFELFWERDFRYLILLRVRITMRLRERKQRELDSSRKIQEGGNGGWKSTGMYATTVKEIKRTLSSPDKDSLLTSTSSGFSRFVYVVQTKTVLWSELVFVDVVIILDV